MILGRRVKHDFLTPFPDVSMWSTGLDPCYQTGANLSLKIGHRFADGNGSIPRAELLEKRFQAWVAKTWKEGDHLTVNAIHIHFTLPINDADWPGMYMSTWWYRAFVTSRFLVCKHLIQRIHWQRVPPIFFVEVRRYREAPFWSSGVHWEGDQSRVGNIAMRELLNFNLST